MAHPHNTEFLPQLEYKDCYSSHRSLLLHDARPCYRDIDDGLWLRTGSLTTFEDFCQKALPVVTRSEKIRIYTFISYWLVASCQLFNFM
ncbi:MAG: hypothetical protein ACYTXC_04415 [Nostoc sp.]